MQVLHAGLPLSIPRYEWSRQVPRVRKCEMCKDRVRAGEPTACSVACPNGATKFGPLVDLADEARARMQAAPGKYHDRIYGLDDFGGTAVLMISDVPLEEIGAHPPGETEEPLPLLTLSVLRKLPHAVAAGGVILGASAGSRAAGCGSRRRSRRRDRRARTEMNGRFRGWWYPLLAPRAPRAGRRCGRDAGLSQAPEADVLEDVLLVVVAGGIYGTVLRFAGGLGASTALNDSFPWGLWIGFDVLCGVALAAGGFTVSAAVYVFHLERFRPVVRPAILTAFLGYLLVICALMFDLGQPWRIWHAMVHWNPHSVMFEVAWCVMLYTTVLALEFSPMLLERLGWKRPLKAVKSIMAPLVIVGVLLSMLHQSSLGSLYLIAPHRMHPLWYSPLLPVFFFISAVCLGCSMTIFESFLSYRAFRKRLEIDILSDLGKVTLVASSSTPCSAASIWRREGRWAWRSSRPTKEGCSWRSCSWGRSCPSCSSPCGGCARTSSGSSSPRLSSCRASCSTAST